MKCLRRYGWVKLLRAHLPEGKGVLGAWSKLATRAAYRKGFAEYCGYKNAVSPGQWSGGIVGLKSILGTKSRSETLAVMDTLKKLGYITFELDGRTKKLTYQILDWVKKCSGEQCMKGAVYTTEDFGFLCLPRDITRRLIRRKYKFEEADAWLDLWCHTTFQDPDNAFSFLAPTIQLGKFGSILTLETLGRRWQWEKTKVWRFFQKHGKIFSLHRLPGSYGCLVINNLYPTGCEWSIPTQTDITNVIKRLRTVSEWTEKFGTDNEHINRLIAHHSRRVIPEECRVALSDDIKRVYLSQCWNCKNYDYDCRSNFQYSAIIRTNQIRGPCYARDKTEMKRRIQYGQQQTVC